MSNIMFIGIGIAILIALAVIHFCTKAGTQWIMKDDLEDLHSYFCTLDQLVQKLKEGSIKTIDIEKEIDRDTAYAKRLWVNCEKARLRNDRISWCLVVFAVLVLVFSGGLDRYVTKVTQDAYQRGAIEALQKGVQQ